MTGITPTDEIKHIQTPIFSYMVSLGFFVFRINQGTMKVKDRYGTRYIKFAVWQILGEKKSSAGIADLMGICKCGMTIWLECKLPGKSPTPSQSLFLECLEEYQSIGAVVHSIDEGIEIIENHLESDYHKQNGPRRGA